MVFRIIFIGDKACGKSSIIRRYCENDFALTYSPSLGIEKYERIRICSVTKDEIEYQIPITFQLWDTSSIWHGDIIKQYFAGMHCVVIIFDPNNIAALENIKKWYELLENYVIQMNITKPIIYIVSNKIDIIQDTNYGNKFSEEIINLIKKITDCPYIEISAKTGFGINNLFTDISYTLVRTYPEIANKDISYKNICAYCFCNIL